MPEYRGNAIYDYIVENDLDYYFCVENRWILIYGNVESIPKILVFASRVNDINATVQNSEKADVNKAYNIANYLHLPFVCVRFMLNSREVMVWESGGKRWNRLTYDQLRDLYEEYGVVQPGTARKPVNQYVSSPYHNWQRQNLGQITVSDFDLLKYRNNQIEEIIELKRSKKNIRYWHPYTDDFPNFALLINVIVGSGRKIPFTLYYNVMEDGPAGHREEDISRIKVFDFIIPDRQINCSQIRCNYRCISTLEVLLD